MRPYVNTCVVLTVMPYTVLRQPRLLGLSAALTIIGLDLIANVGGTVSYLFLVPEIAIQEEELGRRIKGPDHCALQCQMGAKPKQDSCSLS